MRTVTFQSVLWGAARMLGMDPTKDLQGATPARLVEYIQQRYEEALARAPWPELTPVEQRQFRADYLASNTYAAPTLSPASVAEVYDPGSGYYFQALRAVPINEAPTTLSGSTYTENSAYWAQSASSYSADLWAESTDYAVGDQVKHPTNGRYYQCHTAHTSGVSFDANSFGLLTPFIAYISDTQTDSSGAALTIIGQVLGVTEFDPRLDRARALKLRYWRTPLGTEVAGDVASVFVEFKVRPNTWTSSVYASATAYVVGNVVYYPTTLSGGTGECYLCKLNATGQAPTNTTYWTKLDFPAVLANFTKRASAADAIGDQKQNTRKRQELAQAYSDLENAVDQELGGQGQFDRVEMQGY